MTEVPDAKLQAAWQQDIGRTGTCPATEKIWEALHGNLQRSEVQQIVDHTAVCADCALAWRLAHDIGAEEPEVQRVVDLATRRPWLARTGLRQLARAGLRQLAMAAGLLVVLGTVGYLGLRSFDSPEPTYRAANTQHVQSLVSEKQPLPRDAFNLAWTPAPHGSRYTVTVTTKGFVEVARAEGIEVSEYHVPAESLAGMLSGARLMWQVRAFLPDGSQVTSTTNWAVLK